jgi:uncharacterized protein with PIN domain
LICGDKLKFIADVMLGRLAKRLRLRGLDVLYDRTLNDNEIIRLSLEQDRVILTRDTALSNRPLAKTICISTATLCKNRSNKFSRPFPSN